MRKQFRSIGEAMEKGIGKRFFAVDAVLGQFAQVLDVKAGLLDSVEDATWPLADRRTNIALDLPEPADVLVIGLAAQFPLRPGNGDQSHPHEPRDRRPARRAAGTRCAKAAW